MKNQGAYFRKVGKALDRYLLGKTLLREMSGQRVIRLKNLNVTKLAKIAGGFGLEAALNNLIKQSAFFPSGRNHLFTTCPAFKSSSSRSQLDQIAAVWLKVAQRNKRARDLRRNRRRH